MNLAGTVKINKRGGIIIAFCILVIIIFMWPSKDNHNRNKDTNMIISGKEILISAILAAERGGIIVKKGSHNDELKVNYKGTTEPVTHVDVASHCAMFYSLKSVFPNLQLRSEERPPAEACGDTSFSMPVSEKMNDIPAIDKLQDEIFDAKDISVWIDPLDATKEFTEKLYEFVTTMVCVAHKGVPIMGVIHKPFEEGSKTYWAWTNHIMSPEFEKIHYNDNFRVSTRVIVSISHKGAVEDFSKSAFGSDSRVISAAGSGYKVLEVINNRADVYIHTTAIKKWDICAGNAIINAVGGKMTTLDNTTVSYFYDSDEYNRNGLLVSARNHDYYVEKTRSLHEKTKSKKN